MLQCNDSRAFARLLDASIYFSFDRSGFRRHARSFSKADLDVNLTGRVCLVTGANSGIGYATALALAERNATVWLLCRDAARGRAAATQIRRHSGSRRVHFARLDVSDLMAIRHFADAFRPPRVDILVHNAGLLPDARAASAQGYEMTLATHVLGPNLLTRLLVPRLQRSADARVVFVTSGGMYTQRLSLEDLEWQHRPYDGVTAYAQTKRMQVVLTEQLAGALGPSGIAVNAMHPGWADTPSVRHALPRFWRFTQYRLRTAAEAADTVTWLAASDAARGQTGGLWFDRARRATHLLPWTRETQDRRDAFAALLNDSMTNAPEVTGAPRAA